VRIIFMAETSSDAMVDALAESKLFPLLAGEEVLGHFQLDRTGKVV
jgi:hypothetical protein